MINDEGFYISINFLCDSTSLTVLPDIMYNVDQQLFDYCTAKFSNNTQCCVPVFDIRHELPLCPEHAAKAVSIFATFGPKDLESS